MREMSESAVYHVIAYYWQDFKPVVLIYNLKTRQLSELPLTFIDFTASASKSCVGRLTEAGYTPCPQQIVLTDAALCADCRPPAIPVMSCVFEPRCDGERCDYPDFCTRPHIVYLALYNNLPKVGMTSQKRFKERIIEQGADAAAVLFNCENRLAARKLEKEVSTRFKIAQEIKPQRLLKQWLSAPTKEQMVNVYQTYLQKINAWQTTLKQELTIFDQYPFHQRPRSPPRLVKTAGHHRGEVMGIKGRFLIYYTPSGAKALEMSDLVGRSITPATNDDSK